MFLGFVIKAALLLTGAILFLGLAAAARTSAGEKEPRATWILGLLALVVPAPFVVVALVDSVFQVALGVGLLGATGLLALIVFFPGGTPLEIPDTPRTRFDERDIMFSRRLLQPGSERFADYYRDHPDKRHPDDLWRAKPGLLGRDASAHHLFGFPAAQASFATITHLHHRVEVAPSANSTLVDPAAVTAFIKGWVMKLGAVSIGVTELRDYHCYTVVGRGADYGKPVALNQRYAIALTVEMDKEMVDRAPLAPVLMESARQYVESGVIAIQVAEFIRNLGYPARAHVDGDYRVVCPLVARDAGLGEIGRMGLLMTPELGPRVRIAVVTTDLPLIVDQRNVDTTVTDFCSRCEKCAVVCPSDAIPTGDREEIDGVRRWRIDSEACYTLWCDTGTDCARCMAACPYSHPDNWLHNMVRVGVRTSPRFRALAVRGDDLLYGRRPPPRDPPSWMRVPADPPPN